MGTTGKSNGLQKFAESTADEKANKFGIVNGRGEIVTNAYLARYIQCWCRKENGYTKDRKANFAYFMSGEFLAPLAANGATASQVGKAASIDPRWGLASKTPATPAAEQADEVAPEGAGDPANQVVEKPHRQTAKERRTAAEAADKQKQIEALRATIDDPAAAAAVADLETDIAHLMS